MVVGRHLPTPKICLLLLDPLDLHPHLSQPAEARPRFLPFDAGRQHDLQLQLHGQAPTLALPPSRSRAGESGRMQRAVRRKQPIWGGINNRSALSEFPFNTPIHRRVLNKTRCVPNV